MSVQVPSTVAASSKAFSNERKRPKLPAECRTDGSLTDSNLVVKCSHSAMTQLRSLRSELKIYFATVLPLDLRPGEAQPVRETRITRVFPNDFSVSMSETHGPADRVISVGGDLYLNECEADTWTRRPNAPREIADYLVILDAFELQFAEDEGSGLVWSEVIHDDSKSDYLLSLPLVDPNTILGQPVFKTHLVIDSGTFLKESSSLIVVRDGVEQVTSELKYFSYNEPIDIVAPDKFVDADSPEFSVCRAAIVPPKRSERAEIIGVSWDAEGNVAVTFSEPVTLTGDVGLYALEAPRDWTLPYLDGSGTDTLFFDSDAPGNPPVKSGQTIIKGLTFLTPNSTVVVEDGTPVNPYMKAWVYSTP